MRLSKSASLGYASSSGDMGVLSRVGASTTQLSDGCGCGDHVWCHADAVAGLLCNTLGQMALQSLLSGHLSQRMKAIYIEWRPV